MGSRRRQIVDSHRVLTRATSRMDAFSDGVFAIAITILVLEIAVPAGSEEHLLQAVLDQWPSYLAYLVSFVTVGAVWLKHTVLTDMMSHADHVFLRLNLLLLLLVSFVPFPTKLVAEHIGTNVGAERVSVVIYGLVVFAMSIVLSVMWRYAVRRGLMEQDIGEAEVEQSAKMFGPSIGFYAVGIAVAFIAPMVAVFVLLLVAILFWVPPGLFPGRRRGAPDSA